MSRRARRLAAAVAPVAAVVALWRIAAPPADHVPAPARATPSRQAAPASAPDVDAPRPPADDGHRRPVGDVRSLSVAVTELGGLAPDAAPGTRVDVWVAWGPRVSARPRVQLLVAGAAIAEIRPAAGEAPPTAVLTVDARRVADLLYGYRFGDLAVVSRP